MRKWPLLAASVLLLAPLAGCLGSDEDLTPTRRQTATAGRDRGGVEGVVTDDAIQPIEGANVTIAELDLTVTTASDGSYAFSLVRPGPYTVAVRHDRFVSAQLPVIVVAGSVANLDFALTQLASTEGYVQEFELVGFLECGVSWYVLDTAPGVTYQSVSACAAPNLVTGANATNDRFIHFYYVEPPINTMVYEMAWAGGTSLWSVLEVRGFTNVNGSRFFDAQGANPLRVVIDPSDFENMSANFTERCDEGEDAWCDLAFDEKGWNLQLRVFAFWDCIPAPVTACLVLQQEFTHYVTAFYHMPAPDGYSVFDESP